jgi:hypothetical protein
LQTPGGAFAEDKAELLRGGMDDNKGVGDEGRWPVVLCKNVHWLPLRQPPDVLKNTQCLRDMAMVAVVSQGLVVEMVQVKGSRFEPMKRSRRLLIWCHAQKAMCNGQTKCFSSS